MGTSYTLGLGISDEIPNEEVFGEKDSSVCLGTCDYSILARRGGSRRQKMATYLISAAVAHCSVDSFTFASHIFNLSVADQWSRLGDHQIDS